MRGQICVWGEGRGEDRALEKLNWKCLLDIQMEMPRGRQMYISGAHGGALDWKYKFWSHLHINYI